MNVKIIIRKAFLICLIMIAPLGLAMLLLFPMIARSNSVKYVEHYRLSQGFTKNIIDAAVEQMRQDTEYQFYFKMLDPERIQHASAAVYEILNNNREKGQHYQQIKLLKKQVQATAVSLNNLDFPPDFIADPLAHIDLAGKSWNFVEDEFKLTILGLLYKFTYDRNFQFYWSDTSRKAAQKMENLFVGLSEEQRKEIQKSLK